MRRLLRGLHRWCGLVIALFLAACGLTGSLIAFEHELDAWLNPALFRVQAARAPLPLDTLIERVEDQDRRIRIVQWPLDTAPGQSSEIHVAARPGHAVDFDRMFIDPATGTILGTRKWGAWRWDRAHVMPWLNRFHRNLTLPGQWGTRLVGGLAVAWLAITLAGIYLTLPARPRRVASGPLDSRLLPARGFWAAWKPAWRLPWGAKGLRWINDLHRAGGLWMLPIALPLAFTGVYFNLGNEIFKPAASLFGPITPHPISTLPRVADGGPSAPAIGPAQSIGLARTFLPKDARDYEPWYLGYLPSLGAYRVAFKEKHLRERALRVRYEQVFLDHQTGRLLGRFGYESGTPVDRFLVWMYPVHSGKVFGPPGQAAIALGGLAVVLLCVTGIVRYGLRPRPGRRRSRTVPAEV